MTETKQNVVRNHPCRDWDEFVVKVRKEHFASTRIFRGHRDSSWELSSPWERFLDRMRKGEKSRRIREVFADGSHDALRDGYLERFKSHSVGTPGFQGSGLTDNEWWALGRHHGLTTPILDWTKGPFVAAFFAFLDYADNLNPGLSKGTHDGAITFGTGCIVVWELALLKDVRVHEEFEIFSAGSQTAYRQKAQRGLFTRLTHEVHLDIEAYLSSRDLAHCLCRYEIPGQAMAVALGDLELMNITPATMYPDLDGAASMANLSQFFWSMRLIGK